MAVLQLTAAEFRNLEFVLARASPGKELRRAEALLWLAEGETAAEVAERLQVSRRTVYDWVERFQQRGDWDLAARLRDAPRVGRPPTALGIIDPLIEEVINEDPRDLGYRSTGWTAALLKHFLQLAHQVVVSRTAVSRALKRLGFRWKRPRHRLALRPETWRQSKGG
jgi:transposase